MTDANTKDHSASWVKKTGRELLATIHISDYELAPCYNYGD